MRGGSEGESESREKLRTKKEDNNRLQPDLTLR